MIVPGPEILNKEPWRTLIDGLHEMCTMLMEVTGQHVIRRIVLDKQHGLRFGLTPGDTAMVHMPAGAVEIACDGEAQPSTYWARRLGRVEAP